MPNGGSVRQLSAEVPYWGGGARAASPGAPYLRTEFDVAPARLPVVETLTHRSSEAPAGFAGAAARLWYSFPVQLLGLHLRQNHLLLALWALLALLIAGVVAAKFGARYLFLEPEYDGHVGPLSFFLVGLGLGGFAMTWNLTTYLLNARYFPFLATLERPFGKYCINNALLPLGFFAFYALRLRGFLRDELAYGEGQFAGALLALSGGIAVVVVGYILYFRFTNKDIASYPAIRDLVAGRERRRRYMPPGYRRIDVARIISGERAWRVDVYLTERLTARRTRAIAHYGPEQLLRIFRQNHLNALILQSALLVALMATGLGIDYAWLRIPAGASIFILASVVAAVAGAVTYWFHTWRTTIFLALLVGINVVTGRDWFSFRNRAYGLDYAEPLPAYTYQRLTELANPRDVAADRDSMRAILERWRARTGEARPRMVLLCVSGGGLKATYWTTHVLQEAQRATGGELFAHTTLISGASGGMIGAAYARELLLRERSGRAPLDPADALGPALEDDGPTPRFGTPEALERSGRDLLNSVSFAVVSKDLFLPAGHFDFAGARYRKDRAYAFERQLDENLGGVLARRLGDYEAPERAAEIPMLVLTPSVVNDARRLIISPLGVRHLTLPPAGVGRPADFEVDAIDFGAFFAACRPEQLRFTTALRMNATYPYVLPNVYLPSEPPVEVMDAGFRDNFGVLEAGRFLQVYRDWIAEHTGGVTLVQVSTLDKFDEGRAGETPRPQGWIESLLNPLGVATQLMSLQDFQTDETVGLLHDLLGPDRFEFVRFSYRPSEGRAAASMTFHLTAGEKRDIRASIAHPDNVVAMARLRERLVE